MNLRVLPWKNPRFLVGIVGVLLFTLIPVTGFALPKYLDSLRSPGSVEGDSVLNSVEDPVERLFLRGWLAFHHEKYSQSRHYFGKVLEGQNQDHHRYRDTLYFLDRLKLYYSPQENVPTVRVRILKNKKKIEGRNESDYTVRVGSSDREYSLSTSWELRYRAGEVKLLGHSRNLVKDQQLDLISIESNGSIKLGGKSYRGNLLIRARENGFDVINELPLNQYLYGVVKKELAVGWPREVIRAQAVAARSFALYQLLQNRKQPYDLSATWLSQVYGGRAAETPRIRQAVDDTKGEVLTFRGRVVPAYFHANSGGYIELPANVWGGSMDGFIRAKKDPWSRGQNHFHWSAKISRNQLNRKLRSSGHPVLSNGSNRIQVIEHLSSGRAKTVQYASNEGTVKLSANDFRMAVGPGILKSAWFVEIRNRENQFEFEGRGWGHGVGMSQWGARSMAEKGHDYRQILNFYFEPTEIAGQYGPTYVTATR